MSAARATPLRILHVEDVLADAELAERELVKADIAFEIRRVDTREAFLAALADFAPDLILSDYRLPRFDGMQALLLAKEHLPDVPFIITTGRVNEETAAACMRAGAADYVLKDHLGRLGTAVQSALDKQKISEDRRRAVEALRESEERFKSLFENALLGLYRTTPDGSVLLANPSLCRMLGYDSFEELKKRNLEEEGFHPSYARSEFRRKVEEEGVVNGMEANWKRRDGSFIFVRESATVSRDGSGKALYYEGTVEDITERKRADVRIRQLNRLLKTISEINQLIVRTDEKETLLSRTCRVMVEHGGYQMAWVGLANRESGLVEPAAWAGEASYYLDQITVRFDETLEGRGPLGTAVRTGRHVVIPDLAAEPSVAPWRERMLAHGFRTTGSFPLRVGGEVAGALIVYAADAGTIGDEETALLDELAADLGYALEAIEERATRREKERALFESEVRYRGLFESNPHTMLVYDRESLRLLAVNDTAVAKYGYSREEFLSMTVADLHVPAVRTKLLETIRGVPGVVRETGIWPQLRKDGSIVEAEITTHDLTFAGRDARLVLAVDVTERRKAERALSHSRQTMIGILDASPDVVVLLDTDLRIVACNRVAAEEFGRDVREMIGRSPFDMMPAGAAQHRREFLKQAIETGRLVRDHEEESGRFRDIILVPIKDEGGHVTQVAIYVRDVTDLVRADAELARSELYFKSLIENAIDITAVLGSGGEIGYLSPSVERILGYHPAELLGSSVLELVHPEDLSEMQLRLRRVQEDGTRFEVFEGRVRHRDGSWRTLAVIGKSLPPETGVQGVIVNVRDITEKKRSAEALAETQRELVQAQKMEAIGRLAGGVAHDFNNLLTVIQGYGEILRRGTEPGDPRSEPLEEILTAAGRAANLTRQLLAFSRKQASEPRLIGIDAIVNDMAKMIRRLIGEDVEMTVLASPDLPQVRTDPSQVEQVLMNLAVNARDAMPSGGNLTVLVEAERLSEPLEGFPERVPPGEWVVLSVADSGFGMSPETLSHVFEPFFTTKEIGKGTGLGLATVWGIVKQSGGFVQVSSFPGTGTTFRIFFPRAEGTRPTSGIRPAVKRGASETILLVEDEPAVRNLTRTLLEGIGYRVLSAIDASEALATAGRPEERIDLLLTDVVMPGMTGPDLAAEIRRIRPALKVLFMSGYSADILEDRGGLGTETALLAKPFTRAALEAKVREVLDDSGPSEA